MYLIWSEPSNFLDQGEKKIKKLESESEVPLILLTRHWVAFYVVLSNAGQKGGESQSTLLSYAHASAKLTLLCLP